jgi:cation:H+ antiporter
VITGLPLPALFAVFAAAGFAVWLAGTRISNASDVLSRRLGLGEVLGGMIFLALATNLPEVAITVTAAIDHHLGIAIGNILGGIAIQTVVLVVLDVVGVPEQPLTNRAASLVLVLEGMLVIAVLVLVIMGTRTSSSAIFARMTPAGVGIAVCWVAGLWLIGRARRGLPWHEQGNPPDGQEVPRGYAEAHRERRAREGGRDTRSAAVEFAVAGVVTLAGGVALAQSGERIATHVGLSGVLFGATVLAAVTALPEVSTGLAAMRLGDYQLAVSDIFGGNAFLPVLFLLATLVSGQAVLPGAQGSDVYLTALAILLTTVYLWGLIFRPPRQWLRMGPDSILVVVLYALGIAGLVVVTKT